MKRLLLRISLVFAFTVLGFAVMGYHPGMEDDAIYLAAVKADLNPSLYPHNADFFRLQAQATIFGPWMASFVRITSIPLAWAELLWQFVCLFAILWSCHGIARRFFPKACAQWAGVAMVAAMLTLPVSGTALYLADQHLHPRNMAAACILLAVERVLVRRRWQPVLLLALAFLFHPIMAAMGISFCVFLLLTHRHHFSSKPRANCVATAALRQNQSYRALTRLSSGSPLPAGCADLSAVASEYTDTGFALVPLGWIFQPASSSWRKALETWTYYFLYRWHWYEWLGALAPLLLFWVLSKAAQRRGQEPLARFAWAVFAYGVFQQAVAMILLAIPSLIRLAPLQPMRYLQLVYFFMALMAGCLAGEFLLKSSAWRWALYLLIFNGGMFAAQRVEFSASPHLELPGRRSANPWLQAFAWIRNNTPQDAYFALDPDYMASPGEDYHGFRALAERSQMADAIKDASVVTQVPTLGPVWEHQVEVLRDWRNLDLAGFERIRNDFGASWVLTDCPPPAGLDCRWRDGILSVCRIP